MSRYRRYGRRYYSRKRRSGTARAVRKGTRVARKVWYSWPSRFSRRVVGAAVTGTVMTGFRTLWWLGMRMGRPH